MTATFLPPPAERVRKIVADHFGRSLETLRDDHTFDDDLRSDSLDLVEVAMAIEEEFNIEISDDDLAYVDTIGDAVALVDRLTKPKA